MANKRDGISFSRDLEERTHATLQAMRAEHRHQRARQIIDASTDNFIELIKIADLDPYQGDLRFSNWSGISFKGLDLRRFDFTGSRLVDCDFAGALIAGARFEAADIKGANLRKARDWAAYVKSWTRSRRRSLLGFEEQVGERHLHDGAVFQDAPFAPEMVMVPVGKFWMGSPDGTGGDQGDAVELARNFDEGPRHRVTIARPFAVGRFAVTFEEWDWAQAHPEWSTHSGLKPRRPKDEKWGRGRRPVIDVSCKDAQAYCRWLTVVTGKPYRLPSEAEWEYCCRAGTETPFWWGSSISTSQANYGGNQTVPVDSFEANPWGLYQVHGNVWEWCEDVWHDNYKEAPDDGSAWQQSGDASRVLRGGSWFIAPHILRSALRYGDLPIIRLNNIGFRLARTL